MNEKEYGENYEFEHEIELSCNKRARVQISFRNDFLTYLFEKEPQTYK